MDPLKWLRRKRKHAPPPPALLFDVPVDSLPPECRAAMARGARITFRQFAAEKIGHHKFRSRCVVLLDGKPAAETAVTWTDEES